MEQKPGDDKPEIPIPAEKPEKGPYRYPPAEAEPAEANDEPRVPTPDGPEENIEEDVDDEGRFQATDN